VSYKKHRQRPTSIVWWRPHTNENQDYAILATETGTIRFINLSSLEVLRMRCKGPITKMEILEDDANTYKVFFNFHFCSKESIK
jgi:hypothetical protein